jgi:lipid-A-disaccharide synthase
MARSRICIVAGEQSGDNLAAALIRALKARRPELDFFGVAGPAMREAGCRVVAPAESLAVMGLVEVLAHLPRLLKLRRTVLARVAGEGASLFIGVDAPEFNLSLARHLHAEGVPTVQYVSPQVWAWRPGRVLKMAKYLDLVLCLFPFEPELYAKARLRARFVGHPLADQVPMQPDRPGARARLGIDADATVLALLPGSRRAEVERLVGDFLAAARWLAEHRPGLVTVAAAANPLAESLIAQALKKDPVPGIRVYAGETRAVLAASDVVIVASGTATLETLLAKRPMVVAYRVFALTLWLLNLLRLITAPFIAQPNLLAGRQIVPEFIQDAVTPERLGREALAWLEDPERLARTAQEFARIHASLARAGAEEAAEAVLTLLERDA